MGLFDKLRKIFQKPEDDHIVLNEPEAKPIAPLEPLEQEAKAEIASYEHLEEPQKPAHKIEVLDTDRAIDSWERTLQAAQRHPLSQVKVINTQILEELSNVLKSMNAKLDKLEILDQIYDILIRTEAELKAKGVKSEHLDAAMAEIERLTIKDADVLEWISRQDRVAAQQLADRVNLSRSTASFRLNRLAD